MEFKKPEIKASPFAYTADELAVDVGVNIFAARIKKGWTQERLAKKMGTLQPSVARIERGNKIPSLDYMLRVAKALGTGLVAPTFESLVTIDTPHITRIVNSTNISPLYKNLIPTSLGFSNVGATSASCV